MRIVRASVFVGLAGVMLVAMYGCAVQGSQGTVGDDPVATVTYCELLKHPERFHTRSWLGFQ